MRTGRRGGEGAREPDGPGGGGWGGRRLDPQATCGERPSFRLGATGRPQGTRRTFRTRPAGVGWGRRGAAEGGRVGPRGGGAREGFRRWSSPGRGPHSGGGTAARADARHPERLGRGEKGSRERWAGAGAFRGQWWRDPDLGDPGESGGRAGWVHASEWAWPSAGLP